MKFSFRAPPEIVFGAGESRRVPEIAERYGRCVFLVLGAPGFEAWPFVQALGDAVRWGVAGEPDLRSVDDAVRRCREERCEVVVAVGGGSSIDTGKAAAALATNGGAALDYLEDVGGGRALQKPSLPLIAVPTTAGSGAEATWNVVIRVPEREVKRSMRSDLLLPRVAVVDPELTAGAPREVAASAGLDALTHLLEAYVSTGAQPFTDALAIPGLRKAARGLRAIALGDPDPEARDGMSLAALWGGMSLANAGLGVVHGLVAPLGGRSGIPHGVGCACLLPVCVAMNIEALRARDPGSPALRRYREIAGALGADPDVPEGTVRQLAALRRSLGLPLLSSFGLKVEDIPSIVAASRTGSMKYNPVELTDAELERILRAVVADPAAP
jgi:alcohol dehydrogenase class IV